MQIQIYIKSDFKTSYFGYFIDKINFSKDKFLLNKLSAIFYNIGF